MCGIFGFYVAKEATTYRQFEKDLLLLFELSQKRGLDSAGVAVAGDRAFHGYKAVVRPSDMVKHPQFIDVLKAGYEDSTDHLIALGHCRLVTNGSMADNGNNHPIVTNNLVGVHNGIVVNAEELSGIEYRAMTREHWTAASDTKLLFELIDGVADEIGDLRAAIARTFLRIEGSASIAAIDRKKRTINLATNT